VAVEIAAVVFLTMAYMDLRFIRLLRTERSCYWWVGLGVTAPIGTVLGIWCGFYAEYPITSDLRGFSFPFPAGFLKYENGLWMNYVTHYPLATAVLNSLIVLAGSVLLLSLTHAVLRWKKRP
jgi:hypothetical protein